MSIQKTKESRTAYLNSLRSKVQEMSSPKGTNNNNSRNDDRYWKLEVDKAGTGSAVIRFLPAKAGASFPFVEFQSHGFQGPSGKWLIDPCPSTLGGVPSEVCPVCAANTVLWNADKLDRDNSPTKKLASARKRKLQYISNILVVNDPKHPENNGKVFLYKYGKKIFDKIKDQIDPPAEFADMQPVDPFDMEEGANFKLRQVKADGFPNYDKSSFDNPTAIGDADYIAGIEEQMYDLAECVDPKLFKSWDKLAERLALVTDDTTEVTPSGGSSTAARPPVDLTDGIADAPVAAPRAAATAPARTRPATTVPAETLDDEDYFNKLAAQAQGN